MNAPTHAGWWWAVSSAGRHLLAVEIRDGEIVARMATNGRGNPWFKPIFWRNWEKATAEEVAQQTGK